LLAAAEAQFDLMISTDQHLRYQQNLTGRKIAMIVLMTTSWPRIEAGVKKVSDQVNAITAGEYREISFL
jgi:hypothetical protein